ncbi:MAG: aldehyde dehydrogenase family protein, partial [bacterium]
MEEKLSLIKEPLKMFIDGEWVTPEEEKTFPVFDPNTNNKIGEIFEAGKAEIEKAVRAARQAFDSGPWRKMTGKERGELLNKVADIVERDLQKLAYLEALDTGKVITQA